MSRESPSLLGPLKPKPPLATNGVHLIPIHPLVHSNPNPRWQRRPFANHLYLFAPLHSAHAPLLTPHTLHSARFTRPAPLAPPLASVKFFGVTTKEHKELLARAMRVLAAERLRHKFTVLVRQQRLHQQMGQTLEEKQAQREQEREEMAQERSALEARHARAEEARQSDLQQRREHDEKKQRAEQAVEARAQRVAALRGEQAIAARMKAAKDAELVRAERRAQRAGERMKRNAERDKQKKMKTAEAEEAARREEELALVEAREAEVLRQEAEQQAAEAERVEEEMAAEAARVEAHEAKQQKKKEKTDGKKETKKERRAAREAAAQAATARKLKSLGTGTRTKGKAGKAGKKEKTRTVSFEARDDDGSGESGDTFEASGASAGDEVQRLRRASLDMSSSSGSSSMAPMLADEMEGGDNGGRGGGAGVRMPNRMTSTHVADGALPPGLHGIGDLGDESHFSADYFNSHRTPMAVMAWFYRDRRGGVQVRGHGEREECVCVSSFS